MDNQLDLFSGMDQDFWTLEDLFDQPEHSCLSRHTMSEVSGMVDWLLEVDKEHGMSAEALDAAIAELERGSTIAQAVWFANCEWDL